MRLGVWGFISRVVFYILPLQDMSDFEKYTAHFIVRYSTLIHNFYLDKGKSKRMSTQAVQL